MIHVPKFHGSSRQVPAGAPIFNVGETGDFLSFGSNRVLVALMGGGHHRNGSHCNKFPQVVQYFYSQGGLSYKCFVLL